jgi:hypothetical protein
MAKQKTGATVTGFKGFDKDFKCRGFQFEAGKTFIHDGTVKLCGSGFHFCENPLDVFGYYDPKQRFAQVEATGVAEAKEDTDSNRAAQELHIKAEISLTSMIQFGVKFILNKVEFTKAKQTNTGDQSAATNTGDQSAATNTGYRSAATNTGYQSAATNTGNQSAATNTGDQSAATNTGDRSAATNTGAEGCAVALGIEGRASGAVGCWLTIAEWKKDADYTWSRIDVRTKKVDGKRIKADTFYRLKAGKFAEVK